MRFYRPRVRRIAENFTARLPASVRVEDMEAAGVSALLETLRAYRAPTNAAFMTYAKRRIRGAMADALRRWNHTRDKAASDVVLFSDIEARVRTRLRDRPEHPCTWPDRRRTSPSARALAEEFWQDVTRGMPARMRRIFLLKWREGLTIGRIIRRGRLRVSESRVSQVLKAALAHARRRCGPREEELVSLIRTRG